MSSWKTTLGGIILAVGGYFLTSDWEFATLVAGILNAVGGLLVGGAARDNDVSSEQAGANG